MTIVGLKQSCPSWDNVSLCHFSRKFTSRKVEQIKIEKEKFKTLGQASQFLSVYQKEKCGTITQ